MTPDDLGKVEVGQAWKLENAEYQRTARLGCAARAPQGRLEILWCQKPSLNAGLPSQP